MSKQTIAIVLGALVLFATVVVGTLAATSGGSDEPVHTLDDGSLHTGDLPTESTTEGEMGMDHDMGSMP